MSELKRVLMERDGLTSDEADTQIAKARAELKRRMDAGETPVDFCEEAFGLEPDYIFELL